MLKPVTIEGSVKTVRFSSDDGFHILVLDCNGKDIIASGFFPPVSVGEFVTLTGEYQNHPKFGKQFKASKSTKGSPTTTDTIKKYLGSGLFKGIGQKTAQYIVDEFGLESLKVIENTPHFLSIVKGVTQKKAQLIGEEFAKNKATQESVMFLQDKGITPNMALKIFKAYGAETIGIVTNNPYKLIEDINGIGFLTADRIAQSVGIGVDSPFRARAAIIHVLKEATEKEGHTFLFLDELLSGFKNLIGEHERAEELINDLIVCGKLKRVEIDNNQAIYLRGVFLAENSAAVKLVSLINNATAFNDKSENSNIETDIKNYSKVYGIEFNDQQKQAIVMGLNSGVCTITGGPGTGKTTIIKCLLSLLKQQGKECLLMAPTGRAAKRMSESTGYFAQTIHRAIFASGAHCAEPVQLQADAIIVDEVSMVDIFLLNSLLKSIRDGTFLIMLGDSDQLPSVGAGNCLKDILQSAPNVRLSKIYRQAEQSHIITSAYLVNKGLMPDLHKKNGDLFFLPEKLPSNMAQKTSDLICRRLPSFLKIEPDKIQALAPIKNGEAGTINLNRILSNALNPSAFGKTEIKAGENVFKEGDKVMQITNNYNQSWTKDGQKGEGVFNGDMGIIVSINLNPKEVLVCFEDGRKAVYENNLDELVLSYAITVHKSQGSEYDAAVIVLPMGGPMIMTRNLLYTAITRAKKMVVLVGDEYTIKRMVENNYIAKRNSALSIFIEDAKADYDKLFNNQ